MKERENDRERKYGAIGEREVEKTCGRENNVDLTVVCQN
jgi:hypothetical protein